MIGEQVWIIGGMTIDRGRPNYAEKIVCRAICFTTDTPRNALGSQSDVCFAKSVTKA